MMNNPEEDPWEATKEYALRLSQLSNYLQTFINESNPSGAVVISLQLSLLTPKLYAYSFLAERKQKHG